MLVVDRPAHPGRPTPTGDTKPAQGDAVGEGQVGEGQVAGGRHMEQPEGCGPGASGDRLAGPLDVDLAGNDQGGRAGGLWYDEGGAPRVRERREVNLPPPDGRGELDGVEPGVGGFVVRPGD